MAAIHGATDLLPTLQLPRESFENPFKPAILRVLEVAEDPGLRPGQYQRRAARLLARERVDILTTLERMERLGAAARAADADWVLTHGDPNLDNLLKDEEGRVHLTDWGDVGFGPPERDLFAFSNQWFESFLQSYLRYRRARLHVDVFVFYFYRWTLQEIADYSARLLLGNVGRSEEQHAWEGLQEYLPVRHEDIAQDVQRLASVLGRRPS